MNIFQCGIGDQTMNSFMSQQDKIRLFTDLPVTITNHSSNNRFPSKQSAMITGMTTGIKNLQMSKTGCEYESFLSTG